MTQAREIWTIGHWTCPGGRRRQLQDIDPDLTAGWQNASFKNYADYTFTDEFRCGLEELTPARLEPPSADHVR